MGPEGSRHAEANKRIVSGNAYFPGPYLTPKAASEEATGALAARAPSRKSKTLPAARALALRRHLEGAAPCMSRAPRTRDPKLKPKGVARASVRAASLPTPAFGEDHPFQETFRVAASA